MPTVSGAKCQDVRKTIRKPQLQKRLKSVFLPQTVGEHHKNALLVTSLEMIANKEE